MSVNLDSLLEELVKSSPPGELVGIKQDLSQLLSNQSNSLINQSIEKYINDNPTVFSGKYIASSYNKDPNTTKYIDYVSKQAFNVDLDRQSAIDFEDYNGGTYPEYYDKLVLSLQLYGQDHYPSTFAYTVIPGSETHIILIGQRLNKDNFYTGQWQSHYVIKNGSITGTVKLDIHYYEDGNVRLGFDEKVPTVSIGQDALTIVNFINETENNVTIKIIENFNELNQKYFKNLRRLLPVTKSKINWGSAIGNYRLGSDVVNQ